MNQEKLFEKTSPMKLFFLAAIPGGISMLASSLYGLLDGIFVGRILGEASFAALNLAFPFVVINFSLADLIGVGSSVPISIQLGKKKEKEANNIFSCACLMIIITGALLGGFMYLAAPWLIHLLGAEGELAELAVQYMRVYALCSPVTTIVFAMDNYLRICGKIRSSMNLNILMSVLSAALEFIFLGIFRWGIWSAALATCSGMFICAVIAVFPFVRGKLQLRLCKPRFNVSMIRQIIVCGSPNFLSNIAGRITSIIMNIVLLQFGGATAVSIYGVLMYTGETIQSFLYGVCDSLQPAVGYNWGAGRKDRVKAIEKCCFTASALISLVSAVVIFLFPTQIISLFVKNVDTVFMSTAVLAMRLFSLTYITRWLSFATQSYMTAVEKPIYASVLSVSTALVFPVVLIALLWPLELTGIWLNFPITYLLAAILATVILLRFKKEWRKAA
ncbi:MATE family efflux transporter [Lachnoclostridium sp.]|nr:MATE family efflux transporter [Lachnoclostridium sp.]